MKKIIISLLTAAFSMGMQAQKISFSKNTISTGNTPWKHPVTAVFKYTNKDKNPLVISEVDAGCGCLTTKWTKEALQKGEEGEISITYDAMMLGHYDRIINVFTNAGNEPVRIRMKGVIGGKGGKTLEEIYPYRISDILLSTNNVEFPIVNSGDSATITIDIYNDSKDVFTPTLMHLPSYITAKFTPEMIARGRRGKMELTLHSEKLQDLGLNQTSIYLARFYGDKVSSDNEIAVSAVLLPDLHYAESFVKKPSFHVSASHLNLGKLGKKTKLTGQVKLSNKGTGVLKLSKIEAYNQAITIALPKSDLQPGETIVMKVTVDNRFLGMSKAQPRVLIITNDPNHPQETITVEFEK